MTAGDVSSGSCDSRASTSFESDGTGRDLDSRLVNHNRDKLAHESSLLDVR